MQGKLFPYLKKINAGETFVNGFPYCFDDYKITHSMIIKLLVALF